tara:strand:+ start:390 stop:656 length:267 start_codon:yes stop_codon:yes gene_type:complete
MNSSPIKLKQKLSPKASAAKSVRDLAAANSPYRKAARASSQRAHRADPSKSGMDYDHKTSTFKSAKSNRGNGGKGTKIEGKSNYKINN